MMKNTQTIVRGRVTIGRGSVVAAGSVVTKSMPPYSIIAGVPARVIKSRAPDTAPTADEVGQLDYQGMQNYEQTTHTSNGNAN